MKPIIACLALCLLSNALCADSLQTAKDLSQGKFKGWTYGSNATAKQVDCVNFILEVLEQSLQFSLNKELKAQVLISNLTDEEKTKQGLAKLIVAGDDRIKGVQTALIKGGKGSAVSLDSAAPGDFIQYWMKKSDGTWFGHAGIIERIEIKDSTRAASIFGAHQSMGCIATSTFSIKLVEAEDRRMFIGRIK